MSDLNFKDEPDHRGYAVGAGLDHLSRIATPADVSPLFEIFLGRLPEPRVAAAALRRTLGDLIEGIVWSDDFATLRQAVLRCAPLPADRFCVEPRPSLQRWAVETLPLSGRTALTLQDPLSGREMLRRILCDPVFHDACQMDIPLSKGASEDPVDEFDVTQAFGLLLGQDVEADPSVAARVSGHIGSRFCDLYTALVTSEDFQDMVVGRAIGDAGEPDETPISMATIGWVRRRFGVDASIHDTRFSLIAAILEMDVVAATLADPTLSICWPSKALAACLRRSGKRGAGDRNPADDPSLGISDTARGLEIVSTKDVVADGAHLRMTSGDPAITFHLDPEIASQSQAMELTFAVSGARRRTQGVLYLDYGDGFSEKAQIELKPAGRIQYSAMLVKPFDIKAVRWDPDDHQGKISILFMGVRPVGQAELQQALATLSDQDGADLSGQNGLVASKALTRHVYDHCPVDGTYDDWIETYEAGPEGPQIWAGELKALQARPLISVLVPVYETSPDLLRAMIESVTAQVYPDWELCLADDASKSPHVREIIEGYIAGDARIKAVFRTRNGHISQASNSALELATGEWLALLDHDDLLTPDALLAVAMEIEAHPDAAFIYSDEDKLDAKGRRYEPFFKPDFSPELLRSQNYLNHLSVHRTAHVRAAGGWRKGFEGSQDYDLNLRTLEAIDPARVRHIPKVLYHWRAVEGSTALSNDEKGYAFTAGLKALEEHVTRMGWSAKVEKVESHSFYRMRYALPSPAPLVSLIIPTRDRADLLETCIGSILDRTDYEPYEILIVDNGSSEPKTFALFTRLKKDPRIRIVDQSGPFNYSRINNAAVQQSRGQIVSLVNNDIEVISRGWLTEMAAWASLPRIGCVGAKLYYPDDTIQHAGVVLGLGGVAGHSHKYRHRSDPGYFARLAMSHDVSAVTGACLLVRREIWDALGGLDERLAVAFNDVDFCIRVTEAGYTNLFTPFAELYHHESVSRGAEDNPEKLARFAKEIQFMKDRWPHKLKLDPYYSPNLTLDREDYSIA